MTNFLSNLSSLGTLAANPSRPRAIDPLKRMKATFKARAQAQIDFIHGGNHRDGRSWFKRIDIAGREEPFFIASLRNGTRVMSLGNSARYLEVTSEEGLVQFFKGAIAACDSGELDELLIQTAPKRKAGA